MPHSKDTTDGWGKRFAETLKVYYTSDFIEKVNFAPILLFISQELTTARKEGYEEGEEEGWSASKILWDRLDAWNKEWQAESPQERALTYHDALKLIEWKLEKGRKEARKEVVESFERWGRSRMNNYEGSQYQGKVEQMKSTLSEIK